MVEPKLRGTHSIGIKLFLMCHLTLDAPKQPTPLEHGDKLTRALLDNNTSILGRSSDRKRLQFLKATFIIENKPSLNVQASLFDILLGDRAVVM